MNVTTNGAGAGGFAQRRYQRGLHKWRSKIRPILLVVFGPFIAAGLAVLVLDGHALSWGAGMVAGTFLGAWLVMRDAPPRYIETWRDGAEGERKTAKALRPLERMISGSSTTCRLDTATTTTSRSDVRVCSCWTARTWEASLSYTVEFRTSAVGWTQTPTRPLIGSGRVPSQQRHV